MKHPGFDRRCPFPEPPQAVLVFLEPRLGEGVVDAVVHPIASNDQVGLCLLQYAYKPLVQVGAWECSSGMARLREARGRLARQSEVKEFVAVLRLVDVAGTIRSIRYTDQNR